MKPGAECVGRLVRRFTSSGPCGLAPELRATATGCRVLRPVMGGAVPRRLVGSGLIRPSAVCRMQRLHSMRSR